MLSKIPASELHPQSVSSFAKWSHWSGYFWDSQAQAILILGIIFSLINNSLHGTDLCSSVGS